MLVAVLVLVMFSVYSVGQLSLAKTRLQNTADAAAMSAAQLQARDYNFAAYTTRAMIANQVSAAQMVGLTSWMRSWGDTYNGRNAKIPESLLKVGASPLHSMWKMPATVHKRASKTIARKVDKVTKPVTQVLAVLIKALGIAQKAFHYASAFSIAQTVGLDNALIGDISSLLGERVDFTLDASSNMVAANYPGAQLSVLGQVGVFKGLADWFGFTQFKVPVRPARSTKPEDDRLAQVTVDSLDRFSRERGSLTTYFDFPLLPSLTDFTRLIPYNTGAFLIWPRRLGGTELKDNKKTWTAVDAGGLFGFLFIWISILGIPIPIPVPLIGLPQGFGAAQAGVAASKSKALSPSNNFSNEAADAYGGVFRDWITAASARSGSPRGAGPSLAPKLAFQPYLDVTDEAADNLQAPPWLLEVEAPMADVPSSNDRTSSKYALEPQGDQLRAMSKAHVYFARPAPRDDGQPELGSLYNPYWQPRLERNSFLEQYLATLSSRFAL